MSNVTRFPPLPPVQAPPSGPLDPRQETFYRIAGNLVTQLLQNDEASIITTNTVTGYRASAVDVGHLQELLEAGIRLLDINDVRERWDVDLFDWCCKALFGWVQRRKLLRFSVEEKGIRVFMETQDDRGYYLYEFDVFPGKGLRLPRPATHRVLR